MNEKPPVFEDPDNYPGIVLLQPWAGLMWLAGFGWLAKLIESRKRRIRYRGPLVICASAKPMNTVGVDGQDALKAYDDAWRRLVLQGDVPRETFLEVTEAEGVALARFDVRGCRPLVAADEPLTFFWKDDVPRHAWLGASVAALEPFQVKGAQGFIRVPRARVDAAVLARTSLEHVS